jgi:hypothetical protein
MAEARTPEVSEQEEAVAAASFPGAVDFSQRAGTPDVSEQEIVGTGGAQGVGLAEPQQVQLEDDSLESTRAAQAAEKAVAAKPPISQSESESEPETPAAESETPVVSSIDESETPVVSPIAESESVDMGAGTEARAGTPAESGSRSESLPQAGDGAGSESDTGLAVGLGDVSISPSEAGGAGVVSSEGEEEQGGRGETETSEESEGGERSVRGSFDEDNGSEAGELYMGPEGPEIAINLETVLSRLSDGKVTMPVQNAVRHMGNFIDEYGQTHMAISFDFETFSAESAESAMTTERIILNMIQWMRTMDEMEKGEVLIAGHSLPPPGIIRPSPLMAVLFVSESEITAASLFHARPRRATRPERHAATVLVSPRGLVSALVLCSAALCAKRGYTALAIEAPLGTITFLHNAGFRPESKCSVAPTLQTTPAFDQTYARMKTMLEEGQLGGEGNEAEEKREEDKEDKEEEDGLLQRDTVGKTLVYCL